MTKFIGLNIGVHDSSAALVEVENRKIQNIAIYLSERLSKVKHQGNFPIQSLRLLKKEHLESWQSIPENYFAVSSSGRAPQAIEEFFAEQDPHYHDFLKTFELTKASLLYNNKINFITHHLAHAYSVWPQCPFENAIVIVSDGMGSRMDHFHSEHLERKFCLDVDKPHYETLTVYKMEKGEFTPIKKNWTWFENLNVKNLKASDGLGAMFASVSKLIFGDWNSAGKVMGLSAYGKATPIKDLRSFLESLSESDFVARKGKSQFEQMSKSEFEFVANLSATVQTHFEHKMISLCQEIKNDHSEFENLILVGGCALNCLLNSRILKEKIYKHIYIPPFPNDEGIALGSAIASLHSQKLIDFEARDLKTFTPALGAYSSDASHQQKNIDFFKNCSIQRPVNLIDTVSDLLTEGKVIAWIQGRAEVGPRALGHRSILVRPDRPLIKKYLNDHIKFREDFRPYGASILANEVQNYFEVDENFHSPFMTFAPQIKAEYREKLREIVHLDGTSRIQTIERNQNPRFYELIEAFHAKTDLPILLNTSLNIMGQPILEDLQDAVLFFKESQVDVLVYQDYLITKKK